MTTATYKGKRATELTREELIEAYTWAVEALQQERAWGARCLEMEQLFEDAANRIGARRLAQSETCYDGKE